MKKRHLLLVVAMVVSCLSLTGCGRNGEGGNSGTSEVQNDFMDGMGVDDPLNETGADMNQGGGSDAQGNTGMSQTGENTGNAGNSGNGGNGGNSGAGSNTSSDSGTSGTEEASSVTGIITEIKDFMFVIEDNEGMAYGFNFEGDMPQGLEDVTEGDEVIVTYTGEVSEVDAFTGEVLSVEKVENTNR